MCIFLPLKTCTFARMNGAQRRIFLRIMCGGGLRRWGIHAFLIYSREVESVHRGATAALLMEPAGGLKLTQGR